MNTTSVSNDGKDTASFSRRFQGQLRRIRAEGGEANVRGQRRRSEEGRRHTDKLLAAHDFLARAEALVHEFAEPFREEAPVFEASRRLYDGCYELSLNARELLADPAGRPGRYLSRITFLLAPHADTGTFSMRTRVTVANRDLDSSYIETQMTDDGALSVLRDHIEGRFLGFAAAYFERGELTPLAAAGLDGVGSLS